MNELSLYLLDITQNSIKAQAKVVQIKIEENLYKNLLSIDIIDDGCGMSKDVVSRVSDPFYTTRTTRKVGLGIPLLKELCELCCGTFSIESEVNKGTTLKCTFVYDNIDLPYCKTRGIAVANIRDYSTPAVVQHTFALGLYLIEKLSYYDEYVKSGEYAKCPIFCELSK